MISKKDLKELAHVRIKDVNILFYNNRHLGSQYLAGYSVELMLKYNVCKLFNLSNGYPESRSDLESYLSGIKVNFLNAMKNIGLRTFKTHNLNDLLLISGKEFDVKNLHLKEWKDILFWNPELRYLNFRQNKSESKKFLSSVNKILKVLNK
ncbi:MAG: hypothetical protein ABI840_09820 [bacterium]